MRVVSDEAFSGPIGNNQGMERIGATYAGVPAVPDAVGGSIK